MNTPNRTIRAGIATLAVTAGLFAATGTSSAASTGSGSADSASGNRPTITLTAENDNPLTFLICVTGSAACYYPVVDV
ncbi:hypothetical protein ACWDOP_13375 [Nocardia sp. NPDC003693]